MEQLRTGDGQDAEPFRAALDVGSSVDLPNGAGTVSFESVSTWVNLQVSRNAGKELALLGSVVATLGLLPTLFVRRRRVFIRLSPQSAGAATVVTIAGLDRVASGDAGELDDELAAIAAAIEKELA
jgi:cytochrome c biogenesis protein